MGYMILIASCFGCGKQFTCNPDRVPSVRDGNGIKQPVCRNCIELVNKEKARVGLPLFPIPEDAYEPCESI